MKKTELIKQVTLEIQEITSFAEQKDLSWDARVLIAYKVFRSLDSYRFKLEPANLNKCLDKIVDSKHLLEKIIKEGRSVNEVQFNTKEPQDKARRMQYLYGLAWAQQSDSEYYHGASHFMDRLVNSNLDISFMSDAKCLDLGTGHARYALAMIQLGARSVTGIDFSQDCLEEAKRRLKLYPDEASKINLIYKSVYDLPKSMNNSFDFVCANGFIHHLPDPVEALKVMYKTLKKGGYGFTFVFSEDGTPRWKVIDLMRFFLNPVPIWYSHKMLEGFEVPGNKIFNFLDYSYTPIQHRFNRKEFEGTLNDIGFKEINFLKGGVIHDSVLRSKLFDNDKLLYGNSEIRYLLRK